MSVIFSKGLSLMIKLRESKKENLKIKAANLECRGFSKMNKAELAEAITEKFLQSDTFFFYASVLDDRMIELIEKGSNGPVRISQKDDERIRYLNEMDFVAVSRDEYISLSDVTENLRKIRNPEFESYRKRASWVWKCLKFAEDYYGYIPVENLLDVINAKKGIRMNESELYSIFDHFPLEYAWSVRFDDVFLEISYADDLTNLKDLRTTQAGKEFYVPTVSEIEEYYETMALLSERAYQKMARFLKEELNQNDDDIHEILLKLFAELSFNDDPNETLQWFVSQLVVEDEAQTERLLNCYMQLANETRKKSNRGFKPAELHLKNQSQSRSMPVLQAGSSLAAKMLSEAAPEIKKMGFGLDLDSNATMVPWENGMNTPNAVLTKKVYPNDPCPCGSGKKYKRCCGRNN